ncbi:MAG TPA: DUF1206 domain-containing protein [Phenylobacterium sp.]|nr:DUF1206 domain-containing protein [Phenylobacterium sp.]
MKVAIIVLAEPRSRIFTTLAARIGVEPWSGAVELAARLGYIARGCVYLSVGLVALLAALGLTPHARSALGAIEALSGWTAGVALLWFIGLGLCGFALWRGLQAILDVDGQGGAAAGLAARAGQAVSGVVYGGLAVSVFSLLHTARNLRRPSEHAEMVRHIELFLSFQGGGLAVITLGAFILACGVGNMARAVFGHFGRTLACEEALAPWAGTVARIGYFARGLALTPVGFFMARAGLYARASEAHGVGGALETLHRQPMGGLLLGMTAAGLMAFGLFAFIEAAYRPICMTALWGGGYAPPWRNTQNRKVRKPTPV